MRLMLLLRNLASVWIISTACVALYWFSAAARDTLRSDLRKQHAEFQRPQLLNGLTVRLDRVLLPAWKKEEAKRYLVFVSNDSCRYSQAQLPKWTQFLKEARLAPDVLVLFISTNGSSIPSRLRAAAADAHIPHAVYAITTVNRFATDAAIAWTPETVVLDSNLKVRIASEALTPVVAQQIRERLSSNPDSRIGETR
jgi:hypothetical protein